MKSRDAQRHQTWLRLLQCKNPKSAEITVCRYGHEARFSKYRWNCLCILLYIGQCKSYQVHKHFKQQNSGFGQRQVSAVTAQYFRTRLKCQQSGVPRFNGKSSSTKFRFKDTNTVISYHHLLTFSVLSLDVDKTRCPSVVNAIAVMTSQWPRCRSWRISPGGTRHVPDGTRTGVDDRLHWPSRTLPGCKWVLRRHACFGRGWTLAFSSIKFQCRSVCCSKLVKTRRSFLRSLFVNRLNFSFQMFYQSRRTSSGNCTFYKHIRT